MKALRLLLLIFILLTQSAFGEYPKPTTSISIPMRDGVELTTDLYMPSPDAKGLPCILIRSPAGRASETIHIYTPMVKEGYIVAVQDTRSAMDPHGKTFPYAADGWGSLQDGYDAIEWLARSPYTNGKIGTAGLSAMGITQLMLAPTAPPSLKCQYIGVASPSVLHYGTHHGGVLRKNQVEGWLNMCAKDPSILETVSQQPIYNAFWSQFDSNTMVERVEAPAIHYGGWFDIFSQGTLDSFKTRQEYGGAGAKGKQKLLMGPWNHFWPRTPKIGDFEIPKEGITPPIDISANRMFAYYLKEEKNGFEDIPPILYYVMGPFDGSPSSGNIWRTAQTWPIPAKLTPLYLSQDRALKNHPADIKSGTLSYTYSFDNPVPTIGGSNLFLESGPKDQSPIEQRDDVISFTTEPLQEDLEVTGRILAKLYITSETRSGDVSVRLTDVYPDGKSILILDGITHLGEPNHKTIDPKIPVEVKVDLWSTSIVFAKGHRIRILVSGSNFPRFQKSVVESKDKPEYMLHFGTQQPAVLLLPVVRKGEQWLVVEQPPLLKQS